MDIGKVNNTGKIIDYNSTQKKAQEEKSPADNIVDTYSSKSDKSNKLYTYKNTRVMTNAHLIEKFTEFTNKHVAKQAGTMKAYIQGFIDGSGGEIDVGALEAGLYENYGIDAKLDPKNVEEGGIYSAENLSDTLVNFAKSISGGDVSKAEMLLDAAKKGFEIAERMWGGELPEISQRTYDLMVEKFEAWKSGEE